MANNAMLEASVDSLRGSSSFGTKPLSLDDVVVKTAACLFAVVLFAVPGWMFLASSIWLYLGVLVVVMIAGIVLARKAPISAPLALGYSGLLGLVVGAFSASAVAYGGNVALVFQAILGTVFGFVAMLVVYATPFGKRASKATRLFLGVMLGYFLLGLVNIVAALLGVGSGWGFYGVGTLGLVLCAVGVALACWSLLVDIGQIDRAISGGVPATYGWTFGVSLTSSLVWLYMEILRLLSIANR